MLFAPSPWVCAATGAVTGVLGAMLGLGGGVFLVPVLTLVFAVPFRTGDRRFGIVSLAVLAVLVAGIVLSRS